MSAAPARRCLQLGFRLLPEVPPRHVRLSSTTGKGCRPRGVRLISRVGRLSCVHWISVYLASSQSSPEKAVAPHSSTPAWKIPWTEEPDGLQSMGSRRVGYNGATSLSLFTLLCIGEGNGNPLQCSCLENPRDGGAWWAAVYAVAQSRTRLK